MEQHVISIIFIFENIYLTRNLLYFLLYQYGSHVIHQRVMQVTIHLSKISFIEPYYVSSIWVIFSALLNRTIVATLRFGVHICYRGKLNLYILFICYIFRGLYGY